MKKYPLFVAAVMLAAPALAQDVMAADANHDGKITRAEFAAARLANFNRLDRNGDGVVSQADTPTIARLRPQIQASFQQFIAMADLNHDGQVTRDELANAPMPVFDRADVNHDGVIDASEMPAFRAALAQMRGQ
ncbi:MAG: EF-hand domain-containing protein [Sphingomonas sp.]|nr:EF-hand domain-containing protein [Sphingomonas sp.]